MTKFYELSTDERLSQLISDRQLTAADAALLRHGGLNADIASRMVENHIGDFPVPLGLAEHFLIDGERYLIPMATEEPSVIAAASNAAQRIARSGGFRTNSVRSGITAQIVFRSGWSDGSVDAVGTAGGTHSDAGFAGGSDAGSDASSSVMLAEANVAGNAAGSCAGVAPVRLDSPRATSCRAGKGDGHAQGAAGVCHMNNNPWDDFLHAHIARISEIAQQAHPTLASHGGGLRSVSVRRTGDIGAVEQSAPDNGTLNRAGSYARNGAKAAAANSIRAYAGEFIEFDLLIDPGAAMGANTVNTIAEAVSRYLAEQLHQYELLMAILSNCAPQQRAKASACINAELLATKDMSGTRVAERIAAASRFAQASGLRAATHNKGIMNGINAVVLASGNDTRNVNAAAYADLDDRRRTWTQWRFDGAQLIGEIDMPMPIGSVGGAISTLPTAKLAMRLLRRPSAEALMGIIASVGLASNLSAMRALVTRGIQAGHMNLQLQSLAMMAGAQGDETEKLVRWLRANPSRASFAAAQEQLRQLRDRPA
jgi:hydroxymethylglutaryl-CoA reductase